MLQQLRLGLAVLIAFVFVWPVTAQSDNVLTYREYSANKSLWRLYLTGAYDAFGWANVFIEHEGAQLYCQPDDLGLRTADVEAILDSFMIGQDGFADYPVNMLALMALQARFPC